MKKLLITSALVVSAPVAFADGHMSITGNAEMGIASIDTGASATDGDATFHQDVDVTFTFSGETDNGLSFGASVDLDEAANLDAVDGDKSTGATVNISGDFGTLTMGDTDGALDWAMDEVGMGTAIADDHTVHAGYNGNGNGDSGVVLRYDHSVGDFSFAISVDQGEAAAGSTSTCTPTGPATNTCVSATSSAAQEDSIGVGIKYSADLGGTTLGIGLGYQTGGYDITFPGSTVALGFNGDVLGASLSFGIAGFSVVLNHSTFDIDGTTANLDHTAIGVGYSMDALSVHLNYGEWTFGTGSIDGWGGNVNYDLGGGAILALGFASDDVADRYSLGLRMDF